VKRNHRTKEKKLKKNWENREVEGPRTGGTGAKSREKNPENRGRQSTN
jgi:hypothetical protein